MFDKVLPTRPNLEQYKKQAKDLVRDCGLGKPDALACVKRHSPRLHRLPEAEIQHAPVTRTDAQLVIAREHGFESWPKFSRHVEMLHMIDAVASITDPVAAFIEVACVPRHADHASGTVAHAEMILSRYPEVARSNIYTAAILADEAGVRRFLMREAASATAVGGPHGWDALTYLCFSRYLRIDQKRSESFVKCARLLLDSGASAKTGWIEMIDHPTPRPTFESVIYGAAGVARQAELTRVLLEYGADPNDEETPYHVPEGYDNKVMQVLLESGKLNQASLACMLVRKADWHDVEGLRLVLQHGGNPNEMIGFGDNALHHAIRRDNSLEAVTLMLDNGADPGTKNNRDGRAAIAMAAYRGRSDLLTLFKARGCFPELESIDQLIATCALGDYEAVQLLITREPSLAAKLLENGGTLLAEFAGNANVEGIRCLLHLKVPVDALYREGDPYFDIAKNSTALHVAAWRAWPSAVKELIGHGASVNAIDGKGRTPLALAVKACVDSYWKNRRSPESVEALLRGGASTAGIEASSGYDEVDELIRQYSQ